MTEIKQNLLSEPDVRIWLATEIESSKCCFYKYL